MKKLLLISFLVLCLSPARSQDAREKGLSTITKESIQGQLEFLASDWMEGRATGSKGIFMAADYLASMFKVFNIEPFGDEIGGIMQRGNLSGTRRSYFQNIAFVRYEPGDIQELSIIKKSGQSETSVKFAHRVDFHAQTGTTGVSGKAPVFFAGYGLSESDYDELAKRDINGMVVVIVAGYPGHNDPASAAYKKFSRLGPVTPRSSSERNKIRRAQNNGALAVILVNPQANPTVNWAANDPYPYKGAFYEADERMEMLYDKPISMIGDGMPDNIPVFTVTNRVANLLLQSISTDLEVFERKAKETMTPDSRVLQGMEVAWESTVKSEAVKCRNVIGYIEGNKTDEFIVVGAHYDHLGKYNGWIWNGADDNGSGTVGVMSLARAFSASGEKPEKSIIFALWTAEEVGLYGSRYFVSNFPENLKIAYNLNFDMLSRNSESDTKGNKMSMMYQSSVPRLRELTEKNLRDFSIDLDINYRPSANLSGGSDHAPFAAVGIPATFFFAAMHPDYHQPSDELSKLNWDKMLNMIKLGYLNVWELSKSDLYLSPQ